MPPLLAALGLVMAGAGAGAWVAYFRWKDKKHPEPLWIVALAVVGGAVAVLGALAGYRVLDLVGVQSVWLDLEQADRWRALRTTVLIGLIEEGAKLVPVALIARFSRHFDELLDGVVYAGSAAAGFALVETGVLYAEGGLSALDLAGRAAAAPITHALFAAPWGLGLAYWTLEQRRWPLFLGLAVAALAHGGYDLCLARPELRLGAPLLVALLWAAMLATALRLDKRARYPRA